MSGFSRTVIRAQKLYQSAAKKLAVTGARWYRIYSFRTSKNGSPDEALRREVESLLANEDNAADFLSEPALGVTAKMVSNNPTSPVVGRQIGCYRILSLLGAGGMGQVYRARDTKLGRDVAIKMLPADFAADPERLRRFEHEARLLASLNHPHIATIHGLEESDGLPALVMELVEGPTLAEKLTQAPRRKVTAGLPLAEALKIGEQIAQALEAAHERSVIHLDLKPANIKLTRDGSVKVLDFGLAKALSDDRASSNLSQLPTITAAALQPGAIVGTPAYMSPEQARGESVDRRADIWAFGCVLYEMLTGRAAFAGGTLADTLAAILERAPDWTALSAATPINLTRLLQRCLEKDPKRRMRDIGDARLEIEEMLGASASPGAGAVHEPVGRDRQKVSARRGRMAWWAASGAGLLLIGGAAAWQLQRSDYFWRNPLEGAAFTRLTDFEGAQATISRDGKFVVFLSDRDGTWDAWVSQVGTGDVHNLTKGSVVELRNPAVRTFGFSPDGSLVSLWNRVVDPAKGALVDGGWAVPTMGGQLRPYLPGIAELDWSPDGRRIVYHPSAPGDPMFVTEPDEKSGHQIYAAARPGVHNHFPIWSRDGAFIYFVQGFPLDEMDVWRIRPTGGEPERMTFHNARVTFPTFLDSRTLLYLATADDGSGPWIHALDVDRRVSRRISTGVEEYTSVAASADGRRLVATISASTAGLWRAPIANRVIDESGATRIALPTARGLSPRMGSGYILYRAPKAGTDGLWKLADGRATELWSGLDGRVVAGPAIAPDGRRIAFPVQRRGLTQLYVMNADGTGGARRVAEELDVRGAPAWSPDGQWIAIAANQGGQPQLFKIPVGGGAPAPLVKEYSVDPIWSPTGRFLIYSGADVGTTFSVKAVTADGAPHDLPKLILSRGARRLVFLRGEDTLVVLKGDISHKEFWAVDLQTGRERQLTDFGREFTIGDFDVSADGREIIFDRAKDKSDIILIDLLAR